MLKRENLLRMAETKGEWCVSMYMPISRVEPEKNRIRLKNLVFEAEKKLLALDVIPMKVSRLLAPIEMILESVDKLSPKQLLEKALPTVQPIFRQERESAMEIYQDKCGTKLASDNLNEIFKAAKDGRVETLFVPVGKQKWGKFDNKTNELRINQTAKPGDKDLLCVASTRTLQKGGKVFVVLPEQMPDKSSIAAILRY